MDIISRKDAKERGLKFFFTGKACVNGHLSERRVSNGQCIACRAERYDPDYARSYNTAYRIQNQDRIRELDRQRSKTESRRLAAKERYRTKVAACGGVKPRAKQSQEELSAKRSAYNSAYSKKHKDALYAKKRAYVEANRDAYLATQRAWREKNQARRTALQAKRNAMLAQAVPPWFGELDDLVWTEAADLVRRRLAATGIKWAADHMIPILCKTATGLHVWNNCQVIPKKLNDSKNNRLLLTEPREWIKHL